MKCLQMNSATASWNQITMHCTLQLPTYKLYWLLVHTRPSPYNTVYTFWEQWNSSLNRKSSLNRTCLNWKTTVQNCTSDCWCQGNHTLQKNVLGLDVGLFHFIHFHHGRAKLFHPFFPRDLAWMCGESWRKGGSKRDEEKRHFEYIHYIPLIKSQKVTPRGVT